MLSEVSQTEIQILYVTCAIQKSVQLNLCTKQKETHIDNKLIVTKGEGVEGTN